MFAFKWQTTTIMQTICLSCLQLTQLITCIYYVQNYSILNFHLLVVPPCLGILEKLVIMNTLYYSPFIKSHFLHITFKHPYFLSSDFKVFLYVPTNVDILYLFNKGYKQQIGSLKKHKNESIWRRTGLSNQLRYGRTTLYLVG